MAREAAFIILLLVALSACSDFGFEDAFFDDFPTNNDDKRTLQKDGKNTDENETVFVSESTNKLDDGTESITKESVKWTKNQNTGKWYKKRTTLHFKRLQNGTVVEMEDNGSGEPKEDGDLTKVDCINENDCKEEEFCDLLSFACKDCLKINQTCHKHRQCCQGSMCRNSKCEAITGKEGDPCASDKDCNANHCCAYDDGQEICKPFLTEGEPCGEQMTSGFPSFFASRFLEGGKRTKCPCPKGLKCKKQKSFFLYKTQTCVSTKNKKAKKMKKHKKSNRKSKHERHELDEANDMNNEMDFLPNEMMMHAEDDDDDELREDDEEMDNEIHEMDGEEDEDEEENENLDKRSLDHDEFEDDEIENETIFGKVPRLLKSFLKGLFHNFE